MFTGLVPCLVFKPRMGGKEKKKAVPWVTGGRGTRNKIQFHFEHS